jgi:hypothetical protein
MNKTYFQILLWTLVIAGARPIFGASERTTNGVSSTVTGSRAGAAAAVNISVAGAPTSSQVVDAALPSPYAEDLARVLNFDRQVVLLAVKEASQERIGRLVGFDEKGFQIMASGIVVSVSDDKTDQVLSSIRRKLAPLHYLPFVVEMNAALKTDKIGIIKGEDQYEILRIMHTDGDDYDILSQDVIDRFKEWEKKFSFNIIGADSDWVELEFTTLPKDISVFAEEVYDFCPDAVDQGAGSVEGLVREIKRTNRLFLWWD